MGWMDKIAALKFLLPQLKKLFTRSKKTIPKDLPKR